MLSHSCADSPVPRRRRRTGPGSPGRL